MDQKQKAKEMYLDGKSLRQIEAATGIKYSTLKNYTRQWYTLKEAYSEEILKAFTQDKKRLMTSICSNGLIALDSALKKLATGEIEVNDRHLPQITTTFKMLYDIIKTEKVKEEEKAEQKPVYVELEEDPFEKTN
jgi:hypothetical protein